MKFNCWFQMGTNVCFKHSHKECKDFKILVYHINMLCWNLANGPKFRISFLKNMAGTKVNQLLGDYVYTILDKIEVVLNYKEMELEMDRLTSRILQQKDSSCK